jgi:predicted nicotinamide N-methyase
VTDPLRMSLTEQLERLHGDDPPSPALLDLAAVDVEAGDESIRIIAPRDWEQLRHEEGAAGRTIPYWGRVWVSSIALAETLATAELSGTRVLELGCGLGIPSIIAARRGATVMATDGSPDAVVFAAHNLALNDAEGDVGLVDWRASQPLLERGPWPLVIASDVLYTRDAADTLARLLPKLLTPDGEALIADPSRAGCRDFLAAIRGTFEIDTYRYPKRGRVNVHALRPRFRRA